MLSELECSKFKKSRSLITSAWSIWLFSDFRPLERSYPFFRFLKKYAMYMSNVFGVCTLVHFCITLFVWRLHSQGMFQKCTNFHCTSLRVSVDVYLTVLIQGTSERIKDRLGISQNQLHAEWKNNLVYLRETNNNKKTVWKLKYNPPTQ